MMFMNNETQKLDEICESKTNKKKIDETCPNQTLLGFRQSGMLLKH